MTTMNTMTANDTTAENQTAVWDYTVEKIALHTPEGVESGFYGNRRTDTQQVLAAVTKQYNILQNRDLFNKAEEVFDSLNLGERKTKYVVTHDGARARAIFDFRNIGFSVRKADDLILRLKVQNSFDGSLGASFQIGLFRLVCSNGLAVPAGATVSVAKKHTNSLNVDFMSAAIKGAVTTFNNSAAVFKRMSEVRITQRQGDNALENLVKRDVLSARMAEGIAQVWAYPTYEQDKERSAWSLYNATTQHLTHEVEGRRYDLAERANLGVLRHLSREGMSAEASLYNIVEAVNN